MSLLRHASWMLALAGMFLFVSSSRADDPTPLRNVIDREVAAVWEKEKVTPAAPAEDAAILRRLYLDLVGTIPTYDEARTFFDDKDPQKREKLIDRLLDDPRFARHQMMFWDQVLFGRNPPNGEAVRKRDVFRNWLAGKFAKNVPHDQWVRDLLLAEQEGSEFYYVQFINKPEDLTEAFSKAFLGTQLQCTRCHDHPFTNLKQKDFYGMAGFFVRLVVLDQGMGKQGKKYKIGEKSTGDVLFAGNMKELKPGNKGEPVKPKFLSGPLLEEPALPKDFRDAEPKSVRGVKDMPKPPFSRKEKLAEWATSPTNPFFATAAVNRMWGQFMGRGIVHPVDNLGDENKPSHPALLDTMKREFIAHKFDTKWLIRELVNSKTYQLSSAGDAKDALPRQFERSRIRPLTAEEIEVSMMTAAGYDLKTPDSANTEGYFIRFFGEPTNGQGEFQGGLSEHLFLNNSTNIRTLITRKKGNLVDTILSSSDPWEQRVDRMFLTVLTRLPDDAERKRFVTYVSGDSKPDAAVEEAIWVLMNTSEFRFNH